jgi:hypothetical protein
MVIPPLRFDHWRTTTSRAKRSAIRGRRAIVLAAVDNILTTN